MIMAEFANTKTFQGKRYKQTPFLHDILSQANEFCISKDPLRLFRRGRMSIRYFDSQVISIVIIQLIQNNYMEGSGSATIK